MLYNNKFYKNSYEELLSFYPKFYRGVYEMEEILKTDGELCDQLESNIEQTLANSFIDSADESTIALWEDFLGISLMKHRTVEERRRMVRSFVVGTGKISATSIIEMIKSYTNADVEVRFESSDEEGNNRLYIDFDRGSNSNVYISDIENLISRKIPAHIDYKLSMNFGWESELAFGFAFQSGTVTTFSTEEEI